MTATEDLRRLLDERGVEWVSDDTQVDSNGAMDASELDRAHDLMRELGIEVVS